jgi:ribosomal protein RSM22 (predicted rRNA methylase)
LPLPRDLSDALQRFAEGSARRGLAASASSLSQGYRDRKTSATTISSAADVAAYALTRLPATYAAVERVLAELPEFNPTTLLDLGCGPGTASWAATEAFPSITAATLLDSNRHFLAAARDLAHGHPVLRNAAVTPGDLATPPPGPFDLVLSSYALTEHPDPAALIARLWSLTAGALVIIEPGTPRDYQRLLILREKLIALGATIAAPCPHHAPCPLVAPDWCHFSVRLARSRDHMRLKGGTLGYEDEKFSYLCAVRQKFMREPRAARVLAPVHHSKFDVQIKLCNPTGELTYRSVPKRDPAYKAAKKLDWGDLSD